MNHGCAQPLYPLYDLNHVISNISYCLYGLFFILTAFAKRKVGAHFLTEPRHVCQTRKEAVVYLIFAIFFLSGGAKDEVRCE